MDRKGWTKRRKSARETVYFNQDLGAFISDVAANVPPVELLLGDRAKYFNRAEDAAAYAEHEVGVRREKKKKNPGRLTDAEIDAVVSDWIAPSAHENALHSEGIGAKNIETREGFETEHASAEMIVNDLWRERGYPQYGLEVRPSDADLDRIMAAVEEYYREQREFWRAHKT